jgi:hypothetical protein
MRTRQGIWAAVSVAACVAGLTFPAGAAATEQTRGRLVECTPGFDPQPRTDDFIIHSTGSVTCTEKVRSITGSVWLLRDGVPAGTPVLLDSVDTTVATATPKITPCVPGDYQAVLAAEWHAQTGGKSRTEAASQVVSITCK